MAEERIDIEVVDGVDANIAKKIEQIATSADKGATYLERLQKSLNSVNASHVDRLASAMARLDTGQARLINAQARLTAAQNQGSLAAQKVALAQQKVATETARTEAATARAAAASSSAESAAMRLQAAQTRLQASSMGAAAGEQQLANEVAALNAKVIAGEGGIRQYIAAVNQMAASTNAASTAGANLAGGIDKAGLAQARYANNARQTNHANANIIAQLQDIGVSLAGGQNPLLVMIQQGSQLDYIAKTMDGGWKALLGTMFRMLAPLALIGSAIGLLYVGFNNFSKDMATKHKAELDKYAQSLGLTSKEMKKLGNDTVDASGKLKSFDAVTITMADSWNGFIAVISNSMDQYTEKFAGSISVIKTLWNGMVTFLYNMFLGFYASVHVLIELFGKTFVNTFKIAANVVIGVFNGVVMAVTGIVNLAIAGINKLGEGANWVMRNLGFETAIPAIGKLDSGIKSISDNMFELSHMDIGGTFMAKVREANTTIEGFAAAWDEAATAAAKARIAALAAAIIENRGPGAKGKVDHTAEKRALAIGIVNLKLDDELARMRMLKDERAIQQRMDQIEEGLAQKKIQLNDKERASILAKVTAIEAYKYVQSEADRIMEEAEGPLRTRNASVDAATKLYDEGAISLERYTEELRKATRAYDESSDPLFRQNEAIDSAMKTTRMYGVELEKGLYLEQLRLDLAKEGKSLYDENTGKLKEEVALLIAKNDQLRQQQFVQSQLGAVLNPILGAQQEVLAQTTVYAELQRLRELDLINEDAYQQSKAALWVKYNEQKLNASADFFGALASVTKKGTGVVGAISKAAAVAEATIQGYLAVQKALASMPPPFNFVAAAAVAIKTGANVAGILSTNAGSFATGGQFMVQGKSGVDANNINMNVTRGERVTVETPAQQRAADGGAGTGEAPVVNLTSVNVVDPRMILDVLDTAEGNKTFVNRVEANASQIKALLGV